MKELNLTTGPILKNLIIFSIPMIVGNLLQQVYSLVDTMIVGKYISAQALAAVGSSSGTRISGGLGNRIFRWF